MPKDELKTLIREVLKEDFGSFLVSDEKVTIRKPIFSLGKRAGVYGKFIEQQAGISAPTPPGGTYSQAQLITMETAINSIRTALSNFGITS